MASVYQRVKRLGAVYSMCVKVAGKKITRSTGKYNKKEAKAFAQAVEAEMRAEEDKRKLKALQKRVNGAQRKATEAAAPPEEDKVLLSAAIRNCYNDRWQFNVSGEASFRQAMTFVEHLGDIPVGEVDTKKVRVAALAIRQTGIAEATVNRYLAALRTVMHYAKEETPIKMPKFGLSKETGNRLRFYTYEEEDAILAYFREKGRDDMADLCCVLADTGFRLTEALSIGKMSTNGKFISTVDLKQKLVTSWINKGKKVRSVPMTSRVFEILKRRSWNGKKAPFEGLTKAHVETLWSGNSVRGGGGRRGGVRGALQLGPDGVVHAWRHTCASRLVQAGQPLLLVKEWLGHSNITVTEKYAHLAPNALQAAVGVLEGHRSSQRATA
jgi:integrase